MHKHHAQECIYLSTKDLSLCAIYNSNVVAIRWDTSDVVWLSAAPPGGRTLGRRVLLSWSLHTLTFLAQCAESPLLYARWVWPTKYS